MGIGKTVAMAAALAGGGPGGPPPSYILEITGTADATFAGECIVEREGAARRIALEGAPPLRQELTGRGVFCNLQQTSAAGRVSLSIRRLDGGASQTASLQGRGSMAAVSVR